MKQILIMTLIILFVGCKKKSPEPDPVPAPALSSTEQQLIGVWIMDSLASYTGTVRTAASTYTNPSTCKLELNSTVSSQDGTCRAGFSGITGCNLVGCQWKAPASGSIYISGTNYTITQLTAALLRMNYTDSGVNFRYYLHK